MSWRSSLTCLVVLAAGVVAAEPCTLYKASDVANARENVKRYKWARNIVARWKRSVDFTMKQDRAFLDALISPLTPWSLYGQNCPVCVGKQSSMGECGLWRWSISDPDKLTCKYCGATFPDPKYPETGKLVCPRMGQIFTYYETEAERAHPDDKSGKHAFKWVRWPVHTSWSGIIRTNKTSWTVGRILPLAKLYAVTGDVKYAERCAWILDRFACVYPGYLFHSYNGTYADCPPAEAAAELGKHPRGGRFPKNVIVNAFGLHQYKDHARLCNGFWGAGRYGCSGSDGGTILYMTIAYDLIRDAKHPDGKPVLDPETDKRIVNDLILAGTTDTEHWAAVNNKCGPGRALSAAAAILFQRPRSARRALEGFELLMERCFHFDGFCKESPSYSSMHLNLMRNIPEVLRGYSDPKGYKPETGERIDNLNPFEDLPRYRLALESMVRMLAPGRRAPVIGDTHYKMRLSAIWAETLADRYGPRYAALLEGAQGAKLADRGSEYALWYRDPDLEADAEARLPLHTEWFPGWHVGVLRGGDPQGDAAFYLNGYERHGHRHSDTLGILYYALGKELASDRGYIWDDPRNAWTKSTLSHNLVAVDGRSQNARDRHSTLELFGVGPGIEVVQASANAYTQCTRYQRTCALVQLPGKQTYAVDFFRVAGGKLHQYSFHCNGKLIALTTPEPKPAPDKIKWLSNLRAVEPKPPFTATWEHEGTRLALMMLSDVGRLLVADAPGWRTDKGAELNAPPIQQIFAERKAPASQYAALMVPYGSDKCPILSARLLANDLATGAMAVEVKLADRTDYILSHLDHEPRRHGPVALAGHFGFVSVGPDGKVLQAYLLDGTQLRCGDTDLTLPRPSVPLKVQSVEGRTFRLAEPLPPAVARKGRYLLAGRTGYEIESTTERSITVRDYPAIECDRAVVPSAAAKQRTR